ncbi:hypothetical protein EIP86_007043 [Pleurotus ostreatoroseus]|nr:hypothetical protein EIP86_007043 [Pleurotus ostreatoroseus]
MAARKLQSEIDRTLKKVAEGVELFESIYDKMQASTNQTQKEKLETDLKTQIKKLQRLRDQIKTWVASNDIKDKSALLDNRKLIETQMEKFKACEKEMKTKAFSKEGLIQSAKLDPKQQEKMETTQWLQGQVEELLLQVEQAEAEIETLQGGAKKKHRGGASAERLETLERMNERRKWHIGRLELILRLLDNGSMSVEKVNDLKEDVSYFVESNTVSSWQEEEFDEDEGIYDELNLEEEEEKFGLANDDDSDESEEASEDLPPRTPSKKQHHDDESVSSNKRDGSPVMKKATLLNIVLAEPSIASETTKPPPPPNFEQKPMASILKAGLEKPRPAPLPAVRYATVAQAAAAQTPAAPAQSASATTQAQPAPTAPSIPPSSAVLTSEQVSAATSSPSLTHPSVTSPMLSSAASVSAAPVDGSAYDSPALSEAVSPSVNGPAVAASSPQRPLAKNGNVPLVTAPSFFSSPFIQHPHLQQLHICQSPSAEPAAVPPAADSSPEQSAPATQVPNQAQPASQPQAIAAPNGSSTATVSTQQTQPVVPQYPPGVKAPGTEPVIPSSSQTIRPPSTAPQQMLPQQQRGSVSNTFPGSLSDLVVSFENVKQKAKELKRQSWRFHVKYLTWFQRHSEPQAITEEYEQGVYVYFDWEGSWCQRKKSDFRFEYRYLSED